MDSPPTSTEASEVPSRSRDRPACHKPAVTPYTPRDVSVSFAGRKEEGGAKNQFSRTVSKKIRKLTYRDVERERDAYTIEHRLTAGLKAFLVAFSTNADGISSI